MAIRERASKARGWIAVSGKSRQRRARPSSVLARQSSLYRM